MDVNGLRFWMLAGRADWRCDDGADYDERCRRLRLRSRRDRALPADVNGNGAAADAEAEARAALAVVPQARDPFGARAFWDPTLKRIGAVSALPGAVAVFAPDGDSAPDDFALGYDGIFYVAIGGRVVMHDLRGRWRDETLAPTDFSAWRLAADPGGGAWVLDRERQRLAHVHGSPLPERPYAPYTPCTVRPCEENADPPTLVVLERAQWSSEAVAIACAPDGRLALLGWRAGEDARLHVQRPGGGLDIEVQLSGVRFPYALAWLSNETVATRVTRLPREALVYEIGDALRDGDIAETIPAHVAVAPSGDVYPLRDPVEGPFVHALEAPPYYPTAGGTVPLHRLSSPAFALDGGADGARPLDSGDTETVWHRLYLEAVIPPRCGIRVLLAATDERTPPELDELDEWHEHRFGDWAAPNGRAVPLGVWVREASEVPFHQGLLSAAPQPGRSGLFTALIQRSNRCVRALRGRYLWVRVEMHGDERATPELAALRAYASRFSYVERYLPALYREQLFGLERDQIVPADARPATTRADFLERFVDNFEGILTTLEGRIAAAHLLTDARTTPDESLEWLASWIGVALDPAYPAAQRRELLKATPLLYRERGTLRGLAHALDIATGGRYENGRVSGGGLTGGEIVILENWRLRRTVATILGADLADETDPLLGGLAVSGNSFVGDTLVLGEEQRNEFLALFGTQAELLPSERQAVAEFFDRLANRITVLVHQDVAPQDLGLIRRVVEAETPAHVGALVAQARYPFLVSVASLVGVDTYLRAPEPRRPVDLDRSLLGVRDYLIGPASLDPRLAAAPAVPLIPIAARPPAAVLRAPASVRVGGSFLLDGSESTAAPGRTITQYAWRMLS